MSQYLIIDSCQILYFWTYCSGFKYIVFIELGFGYFFFEIFSQEKFPPNIYYKIFTHRNIVDLCANAPRDYTQATTKRLPVEFIHNKGINAEEGGYIKTYVDCEQSLFFLRFSKGSAGACELQAARRVLLNGPRKKRDYS